MVFLTHRHPLRTRQGLTDQVRQLGRSIDVLNGIAWDDAKKRLFVTGKLWPRLFEIRLVPRVLPDEAARVAALSALREECIVLDTSIFG